MNVLKWLLILALLALLLVAGLVALMPARFAVDMLGTRLGPLQLQDVSGTIWNGRAGSAVAHGQPLGALDWKIHPRALLGARLDLDLGLQGSAFEGRTFASLSGNTVRLRDAVLFMDAQHLQPAIDIPALQLRGRVEIRLVEAELVAGFPRQLRGEAYWRDAAVAGAAEALLGTLSASFHTADGAVIGTLQDEGGPLSLDGQFRAGLTGYEADALLVARDGNPQVIEALRHVGEPQADGSSLLQIRGRLLPLP
jgi:general secretion pathway protein N